MIERELGRGGMAVVYAASDITTGEQVALKLLDQEVGAAVGADRFRREIRIATNLQHPNVLSVLDSGEHKGQLFFTMPVVTGQSLHARLAREEQLPVDEAVRLTKEVAAALAYAHERGVVHRDIKPENILLQDGHALLADFGIARASSDLRATQVLTRTGMSMGTPTYMSPEQSAAERDLDGRSDQYSLACVLYEMLVGQPPFTAKNAAALMARHMLEPVPPIGIQRSTVPEQVEDAIIRAMAKSPADRFPTIQEFADALGSPETWPKTSTGRTRTYTAMHTAMHTVAHPVAQKTPWFTRKRIVVAAAGVAAVAVAAASYWKLKQPPAPAAPAVLIAIAPFNALRPEWNLWQEGLVDVLARNLDGAGPIGTVAPTVSIRGWQGRKADRTTAGELARRTNAKFVVFGSINSAAGGAARLNVSLLKSGEDRADSVLVDNKEFTGIEVQVLADSATRFVLNALGERYAVGAVRATSLGSLPPVALKAFLEGEQQFRRTAWEPALAAYTRAVALDTGSALPYRRMGQILAFQRDNTDSLSRAYKLRAGALKAGLSPRDSLLVKADSLFAALVASSQLSDWNMLRRLFATLREATVRYPNDPEAWYALGEAGEHLGYSTVVDVTDEQVFEAFSKAIAADSGFAPAYIHGVELAFQLRGLDEGRRYARAYLALQPTDRDADGIRLLARLTDPATANTPETQRLLDTLPHDAVASAFNAVSRWPDSAATSLMLVRAIARRPSTSPTHASDSALAYNYLPYVLAYRGRLRESYEALGDRRPQLFAELVLLGGIEQDTADAVFARWLDSGSTRARSALGYWTARRDSASLKRFLARSDSASRTAQGRARLLALHDAASARAYLSLADRDTTAAIKAFGALSDTLCLTCYLERLTQARLLAAKSRFKDADVLLRQRLYAQLTPIEVLIALERGRVASQLKDTATARRSYSLVVNAWSDGDPEVQPMVEEARAALRGLRTPSISAIQPAKARSR